MSHHLTPSKHQSASNNINTPSKSNDNNNSLYSWHLSLRVDRPMEGCNANGHAYMYPKKLDSDVNTLSLPPHTRVMNSVPPDHEFRYRWFRGPQVELCAYQSCPRRTSFSPHDWSKFALKEGGGCPLQCVSQQSSLYKMTFCNAKCFTLAWKSQNMLVPKQHSHKNSDMSSVVSKDDLSTGSAPSNGDLVSLSNNRNGARSIDSTGGNGSNNASYNDFGASFIFDMEPPEPWLEISSLPYYVCTADDVGRKLKLEAVAISHDGETLMKRVVKTDVVLSKPSHPKKRNLVTAKVSGGGGGPRFRVCSYNILAEIYATQQQYPYCDLWTLSWEYRFHNIVHEIIESSGDIICLQEVQYDHYDNYVYAALSEAGYEGIYKHKTRAAMGLAGKVDGCAIFWKRNKLHMVENYSIEFNELAQRQSQVIGLNPRSDEGSAYLNRLSRDNIAQLLVLEFSQTTLSSRQQDVKQICIANTHLYSHKDYPDVKLWQTWQLLQELESFILSRGSNMPLLLCGDFNSTPDTAVYDLLSRQGVHPGHPDVNVDTDTTVLPSDVRNITHSLSLGSAYATVMGSEPLFTNYTKGFKGVLDYMWYTAQNIRILSTVPIPDESILTEHGEALPSTMYSSDHVMLISDMQLYG